MAIIVIQTGGLHSMQLRTKTEVDKINAQLNQKPIIGM